MKARIRPSPLVALPASNDNTATMIVRLWPTMPVTDQAWVRAMLFDQQPARVQAEIARVEESLDGLPVAVLRPVRNRLLTDAALRQRLLDQRDACYRQLASILPARRSGYAMTQEIRRLMRRYRDAGSWRFDRGRAAPAADPIKRLLHAILILDNGEIRSRWVIARAIAGTRANFRL